MLCGGIRVSRSVLGIVSIPNRVLGALRPPGSGRLEI